MSEAIGGMVIDQPGRLHMSIDDRTPNKSKSPLFKIFGEGIAFRSCGGDLRHFSPVIDFGSVAHKFPDIRIERPEFFLHREKSPSIGNGGFNLESIANDSDILKKRRFFSGVEFCDLPGIKFSKRPAIPFTTQKDGRPGQSRLRPFQDQHFKMSAIIMHGDSPFFIMIGDEVRFRSHPSATDRFLDLDDGRASHMKLTVFCGRIRASRPSTKKI